MVSFAREKFLPANNKPRASAFLRTPPFPLLFLFVFSSFSLPSRCTNAEDKAIKLWSRAKRDRARASFSPRPFLSFFFSPFFSSLFSSLSLFTFLLVPPSTFRPTASHSPLDTRYILHITYRRAVLLLRNFGKRANRGKITPGAHARVLPLLIPFIEAKGLPYGLSAREKRGQSRPRRTTSRGAPREFGEGKLSFRTIKKLHGRAHKSLCRVRARKIAKG